MAKGLLSIPAGRFDPLAIPYTIPNFVWKHLQKNRQLFFPDDEIKQSKVQNLFDELDQHIHRYDGIW